MEQTERREDDDRPPAFRELARDAVRYWEGRRLVYNLVLALVVAAHYLPLWFTDRARAMGYLTVDSGAGLFILAVIANVLYCAAYPVDLLVQYVRPRGAPATWRFGLFLPGTTFAAALAHFCSMFAFLSAGID
jgi:hypothetical protein